jgi:hypothetical protein
MFVPLDIWFFLVNQPEVKITHISIMNYGLGQSRNRSVWLVFDNQ